MKKLFSLILVLFLCSAVIFSSGCTLDVEELLPSPEEYGEWDGNYIYRGNVRAKTTGEDEELCVPEIKYEEEIYELTYSPDQIDFLYIDDNTILIFAKRLSPRINDKNLEGTESKKTNKPQICALIKYLIKEQTHEIIYVFKDRNAYYADLERVCNNYAVISYSLTTYVIDMEEKNIAVFKAKCGIWELNDCIIIANDDHINYAFYGDTESKLLLKNALSSQVSAYDVVINNTPLIKLGFYQNGKYIDLIFVDIKTQKIYDFPINHNEDLRFIRNDLILKGEFRTRFDGFGDSEQTYRCKLYKLTIVNDVIQCDEFFTFRKDLMYESADELENNLLAFRFISPTSIGSWCLYKNYIFDPTTKKLTSVMHWGEITKKFKNSKIKESFCRDYVYYFTSERTHTIYYHSTAVRFMSKNVVTGEERLLQCFATREGVLKDYYDCRFSKGVFIQGEQLFGDDDREIIKILPY